ncbi:hypothetical protein GIB67_000509 [Kingdonia uniflora]|uniref:VQ domain-containing protein n=1 Tax=Kingdonia uniflora TaxID=39325 RepID=A0A7J7L0F2_9MAGN|nr:hypothetical protein GIB67_000509 [Kingdonia uniflora]
MDNSNYSRDRHNEHLGVNKIGKNIRKSPLHQPNYGNVNKPQPPQPHVYNISKNDFRNIVQQLTGSPSHNQPPPRPTHNPPRPPSMRLQRIRPPPLTPITRPPPYMAPPPLPMQPGPSPRFNNNNYGRSAPMGQQQPLLLPLQHRSPRGDAVWANTAESPISQYMRYLQNSMMEPSPRPPQGPPQPHMPGLLPTPPGNVPFPSSRGNGLSLANTPFPSPRGNGPSHTDDGDWRSQL